MFTSCGWAEPTSDAAAGACWLLANAALVAAAWRWAGRLFPHDSYLNRVGHTVVLGWGAVVAVATALGAVGVLTGAALLGGVTAVAGVGLVAGRTGGGGLVPVGPGERGWLRVWGVLAAFWLGHVAANGLLEYPDDWDSLAYHIPLVDHWIQAKSLWATGCSRWANPGNNELLALWAAAPFSGDFLVGLNNLPAAVLLASAGVAAAARVGLPRPLAHLTGVSLVCNFVVLKQLIDQENDVATAACFFAALGYALRHSEEEGPGPLVLGAISLGLLAGVKYYALGYAMLLLGVWVTMALVGRGRRAAARALVIGMAGLFVFGGFWYIRNWVATGTPLYPKGLTPETDLLAQIYPHVEQTSFFGNDRRSELFGLYLRAIWHRAGPIPVLAFMAAPVSCLWLLGSAMRGWVRGTDPPTARARAALAVVLAGTGLLLGITPMAVEDKPGTLNQLHYQYSPVRYGLCFLDTATVALVVLLTHLLGGMGTRDERSGRIPGAAGRLVRVMLSGGVLFQVCWTISRLYLSKLQLSWMESVLITANGILGGGLVTLLRPPRLWGWVVAAAVAVPAWGWMCAELSAVWHRDFIKHYDLIRTFDGLRAYAPSPVPRTALVLQMRCYPYFGSRREHQVHQPVYAPSPEWVMAYVRTEQIGVVVAEMVMSPDAWRRYAAFDPCPDQFPDKFNVLFNGNIIIYTVANDRAHAAGSAGGRK